MKIKWGSPYSCFEVEKPVNMLSPGLRRIVINHKEMARNRTEEGKW